MINKEAALRLLYRGKPQRVKTLKEFYLANWDFDLISWAGNRGRWGGDNIEKLLWNYAKNTNIYSLDSKLQLAIATKDPKTYNLLLKFNKHRPPGRYPISATAVRKLFLEIKSKKHMRRTLQDSLREIHQHYKDTGKRAII